MVPVAILFKFKQVILIMIKCQMWGGSEEVVRRLVTVLANNTQCNGNDGVKTVFHLLWLVSKLQNLLHPCILQLRIIISTSWGWPPQTQRMERLHWYVGLWVGGRVGVVKPCPAVVASMLPRAERSVLWLGCVLALLWCSQTHWCSPGVQVKLDLQPTFSTHCTIDGAGPTSLLHITMNMNSAWVYMITVSVLVCFHTPGNGSRNQAECSSSQKFDCTKQCQHRSNHS